MNARRKMSGFAPDTQGEPRQGVKKVARMEHGIRLYEIASIGTSRTAKWPFIERPLHFDFVLG
jgi:hypothetical protein